MFKGELVDIETVIDDAEFLYRDTVTHCGVLETTLALYGKCLERDECETDEIISNVEHNALKLV